MNRIGLAIAAATLALVSGPAGAAVLLDVATPKCAGGSACFDRNGTMLQQVGSDALAGIGAIDALRLNRSLLGDFGDRTFKVSFLSADGAHEIGSLGSFNIGGLAGDQLTLRGPEVALAPGAQGFVLKIQLLNFAPGGVGGGGGGGWGGGALGSNAGGFSPQGGEAPPGFETASQHANGGPFFGTGGTAAPSLTASQPAPSFEGTAFQSLPLALDSPASPNPEPSAWALMILGFGACGSALRRRRTVAA